MKIIREKYILKFLPKLLKNVTNVQFLGKEGRLCTPRMLFLFESHLQKYENDLDYFQMEEEMEEHIYKLLRNEFIIVNNSSMSLFSVTRKRRFVYFSKAESKPDPVQTTYNLLMDMIDGNCDTESLLDQVRPFKGFAKSWSCDSKVETYRDIKKKTFKTLISEHVREALMHGFDDNLSKFRGGKGHFCIPNMKHWLEAFRLLHKIFIENPTDPYFEANDSDYVSYLENFHGIIDIDERFFEDSCQKGFDLGLSSYNDKLPQYYGFVFHEQRKVEALNAFTTYARGPLYETYFERLKDTCESIWLTGKQACEKLSLRGNSCILAKHEPKDQTEHSSGCVYVSACNCGKIQGNRADPYTVRQANYDFYHTLALSCPNCLKVDKIRFPVFEPSSTDYKAAPAYKDKVLADIISQDQSNVTPDTNEQALLNLSGSQIKTQSQDNLSLQSHEATPIEASVKEIEPENEEIVLKIIENDEEEIPHVERQISTTEYLASMVQVNSPLGLLPEYPSFSLVCIGPSSLYSHNTGLPESIQSGFLSGSNFLLPWDLKIRLEHQQSRAKMSEKTQRRRKNLASLTTTTDGVNFNLKIFVGCEYECQRGHRFFLATPNQVLKSSSSITRDCGSKIVFNDMPLYFPCPCRSAKPTLSQLMRIHVVTPKAPVNVIIDPKIKLILGHNKANYIIFTTGVPEPIKLSQSTYWILRLPYIYESEGGPIMPPMDVTADNASNYGCLLSGMYGVKENEAFENFEM